MYSVPIFRRFSYGWTDDFVNVSDYVLEGIQGTKIERTTVLNTSEAFKGDERLILQ